MVFIFVNLLSKYTEYRFLESFSVFLYFYSVAVMYIVVQYTTLNSKYTSVPANNTVNACNLKLRLVLCYAIHCCIFLHSLALNVLKPCLQVIVSWN